MIYTEDETKIMGLEVELDILVEQILHSTNLARLKETTLKNFPEKIKICSGCEVNLWQDVCICN